MQEARDAGQIKIREIPGTRGYPGKIREGIARALAVPGANFAWDTSRQLYLTEKDRSAKDGLACALAAIAQYFGSEHLDEMIDLVRDRRHGPSRLLLLSALRKSKEPRAWSTIMDLGTDPDLVLEIQHILKQRHRNAARRIARRAKRS